MSSRLRNIAARGFLGLMMFRVDTRICSNDLIVGLSGWDFKCCTKTFADRNKGNGIKVWFY
jgi:hypothetical protein